MTDTPEPERLKLRLDPDGLLPDPPLTEPQDEYTIWISGLTKAQYAGLVDALKPGGRSLSAKIASKIALFGVTMVFLAGCIWLTAQILTPLTNR